MRLGVVTLFPEMMSAIRDFGISSRAINAGLVELHCWNPRDFTEDRHRTVDDRPYGGGPGMVMKTEPLRKAVAVAKEQFGDQTKVIYLSPQGRRLDQAGIVELSRYSALILIAGRYEGIDERFIESEVDEEWSIGDYVLSGGELPAMVLIDALIRQIPGALGHNLSALEDSFATRGGAIGLLDCPHYTRPEIEREGAVPEVLLSGDHERIRRWRLKQSLGRTWLRRRDIIDARSLTREEDALLKEFVQEIESK